MSQRGCTSIAFRKRNGKIRRKIESKRKGDEKVIVIRRIVTERGFKRGFHNGYGERSWFNMSWNAGGIHNFTNVFDKNS